MVIVYGCCVGSWDKFQRYVVPRINGREMLGLAGQTSIAEAYNKILAAYRFRSIAAYRPVDPLVLLHDDLEITDPDAEAKFLAALEDPDVALVGVAGGQGDAGLAWWNRSPVGHQQTDSFLIDFGPRYGDVDLLEGSILVFSPWAIKNLRFDEHLTGFHGYDSIAAQARRYNKRVVVVDVDTHHHTMVGFKSRDSEAEWQRGDLHYRERWIT